ncbi:MAG: hypothetical protein IK130_01445 [Oscillospiraceae bacterium]|nr:hypothetical protein [Oscillospiraceae bacterium]
MNFVDELNAANQKRKEEAAGELDRKTEEILGYVKEQMMYRVNSGDGNASVLTEQVQIRVSRLAGAEYDIPNAPDDFGRAFRLFGDALLSDIAGAIKASVKFGAGSFEVRSIDELSALIDAVTAAANAAGIENVTVQHEAPFDHAVLTFSVDLNGGI